jgi:DNA polymerase I-like protein with 3'-5' exonuclease and polymerase domains
LIPWSLQEKHPDTYFSSNYLVLDFEVDVQDGQYGSAVDKRNQLFLACWKKASGQVTGHFGSEFEQEQLVAAVKSADFLVAHNAKYELGWLRRIGVDIESLVVFDTMLAEYVLAGNLASVDDKGGPAPLSLSLDACCRRRGLKQKDRIVDLWMQNEVRVSEMPTKWILDRCQQDVTTTERLFILQREQLLRSKRLPVLFTRCLLTPVLTDLEAQGVCLDSGRVSAAHQEYTGQMLALTAQMDSLTGGINWRSPKQAGEFIYDTLGFKELKKYGKEKRTKSGGRATDAKTLAALSATTEEQKQFLQLRKDLGRVAFALSKNLEYFKHACDTNDGIFYARFNQAITATHRLSSSGLPTEKGTVQLMNLTRIFKPLFRARTPGHLIMELDGSQLEFRVAAFLGNDAQAKADLLDPGWDAHITTASYMYGIPYDELYARWRSGDKKADAMRTAAKAETFKPLYGGSQGTPAQERWYRGFRERYSGLARIQEGWVAQVREKHELRTPWGLRYYWPHSKVNKDGYCNVTASVYNYPIQALATAEIIPIALVYFWHATAGLRRSGALRIVNTVHDSVVCELSPDVVDAVRQIALDSFGKRCYAYMQEVYALDFDVPLGMSCKVGEHLGEGVEESYNLHQNGNVERVK